MTITPTEVSSWLLRLESQWGFQKRGGREGGRCTVWDTAPSQGIKLSWYVGLSLLKLTVRGYSINEWVTINCSTISQTILYLKFQSIEVPSLRPFTDVREGRESPHTWGRTDNNFYHEKPWLQVSSSSTLSLPLKNLPISVGIEP